MKVARRVFALFFAILLSACGGGAAPAAPAAQATAGGAAAASPAPAEQYPPTVKFGIGGSGSFAFMVAYVALNQGYMAEELGKLNVKVESVDLPGSVDGIRAVDTGTVDYAATVASTMVLAVAQGANLQQIFTYLDSDLVLMTSRPGIDASDHKDLVVGRTWGIPSVGSSSQVTALKLLKSWGYAEKDVNWVIMGNVQAAAAAVQAKRADVYWLGVAPGESFLADKTLNLTLDFYDLSVVKNLYGGPYVTAGIIGNPKFMASHPKLTKAIIQANLRALQFIHANVNNPDVMKKALPESMRLPYLAPVLKRITAGHSKDGMVSVDALQTVIGVAKDGGLIKPDAPVDAKALVSNAYR